jgi:hypothetical protein
MKLTGQVGLKAVLSLLVVVLLAGPCGAWVPELKSGVYIYDGSSPLDVGGAGHSTPFVVDWNNDGRKDLLVGRFTYGNIWLFLNHGTDANRVFSGGSLILSGGVPISTSSG